MSLEAGLPASPDVEKYLLGSIFLDDSHFVSVAAVIKDADFSVDSHRRIFRCMERLHANGERIDRITVATALQSSGELESVGGLGFIVTLDDGLPTIPSVDAYTRIVKERSLLRSIVFAGQHLMNRAMTCEESSAEILSDAGKSLLELSENGQTSTLLTPAAIVENAGGVSVYLDRKNRSSGLASGFKGLDVMTGGFKPGCLYILAARPAQGKSALALNIAEKVSVDRENTTALFSLEMDGLSLVDRLICSRARVNTKRFEGGWLDREERQRITKAAGEIIGCDRILIDEKAVTNLSEVHAKIRQQQAKGPVGLVIHDYLQLMVGGSAKDRTAETSLISRGLKLIAKDCKVPVLALSQLSRACEQRGHSLDNYRPVLSDLRESGGIEQDADVVMFCFRPEVYFPDREDLRGEADLILAKQRAGPTGTVPLTWLKEIVRFEERAVQDDPSRA